MDIFMVVLHPYQIVTLAVVNIIIDAHQRFSVQMQYIQGDAIRVAEDVVRDLHFRLVLIHIQSTGMNVAGYVNAIVQYFNVATS